MIRLACTAALSGNLFFLASTFTAIASVTPAKAQEPADFVQERYILGPGDSLFMEILNAPELQGIYNIGPDGTAYFPRLRSLSVTGLSVDELRVFLRDQYSEYIKSPEVYLTPARYRPVRVYVGGEIARPGFYTLSRQLKESSVESDSEDSLSMSEALSGANFSPERVKFSLGSETYAWPTLFDAVRAAGGVTPFSDLKEITVTRKTPFSQGGGKIRATIDFLRLVTTGDDSVNIRLFDGDSVSVKRSSGVFLDQLLAASRTNLSPDRIEVYITGRVRDPGAKVFPQGVTLNQAIAGAGGVKLLHGGIDFLRFSPDGAIDKRSFSIKASADKDDYKNPILMPGDIIRVRESVLSSGVELLNEVTGPAVGIYSLYSLFKP